MSMECGRRLEVKLNTERLRMAKANFRSLPEKQLHLEGYFHVCAKTSYSCNSGAIASRGIEQVV